MKSVHRRHWNTNICCQLDNVVFVFSYGSTASLVDALALHLTCPLLCSLQKP